MFFQGKMILFQFFFFYVLCLFLFHSLISVSRLLDTKLMASTQPFKVNDFGELQLTGGCQFHLLTCASSFSRRWSPTPLWQSWRSSWRKAPSSLPKLVGKCRPDGVFVSLQMSTMVIFTVKKPPRDSPVMTRPRNSSMRPGMTLTSPASVSSRWPTISVSPLTTATFDETLIWSLIGFPVYRLLLDPAQSVHLGEIEADRAFFQQVRFPLISSSCLSSQQLQHL